MSKPTTREDEIVKRLNAVIRLLSAQLALNEKYEIMKIYSILSDSGLNSNDIATIFGLESKNVSSMLNRIKKK